MKNLPLKGCLVMGDKCLSSLRCHKNKLHNRRSSVEDDGGKASDIDEIA